MCAGFLLSVRSVPWLQFILRKIHAGIGKYSPEFSQHYPGVKPAHHSYLFGTLQKWLTLVGRLRSAIDAVSAAPPSQQFKTAPPGNLTRETPNLSPLKPPRGLPPVEKPEPDWVCVSAFPAGAALQAPVSAVPIPHPSTSTRASPASLQVR